MSVPSPGHPCPGRTGASRRAKASPEVRPTGQATPVPPIPQHPLPCGRAQPRGLGGRLWRTPGAYVLESSFSRPRGQTAKNRLHLDLRAAPVPHSDERMAALEAECERLFGFGATRLRRDEPASPTSAGYIVIADPEGNDSCLG
ncbi:VOC family protein [Nonomuraea wenchangensis]